MNEDSDRWVWNVVCSLFLASSEIIGPLPRSRVNSTADLAKPHIADSYYLLFSYFVVLCSLIKADSASKVSEESRASMVTVHLTTITVRINTLDVYCIYRK